MTSEIVIINQQGIALAADSAVTIGRKRVWKHASKLFSAGPNNDIGIMIYNTGDFIGIPWEVIVKEHRRSFGDKIFPTVKSYVESFTAFISGDKISNENLEAFSFMSIIVDIIDDIRSSIKYKNKKDFNDAFDAEIEAQLLSLEELTELTCNFAITQFMRVFRNALVNFSDEAFGYKLNAARITKLGGLVYQHVKRNSLSDFHTGIVIAGYGRNELFPSVHHLTVDGKCLGLTRLWEATKPFDLNDENAGGSALLPYAQTDMAFLFMEGISRRYPGFLATLVREVLNKKSIDLVDRYVVSDDEKIVEREMQRRDNETIVQSMIEEFATFRKDDFVDPVLETISALPKEEMAFMAKAMVEITALRRKFASQVESVGGEIDVALITKGDGFIWMSRKHYFDVDINHDFMNRKSSIRGLSHEEVASSHGADNEGANGPTDGRLARSSARAPAGTVGGRGSNPRDGSRPTRS